MKTSKNIRLFYAMALMIALVGCASKPQLYPNPKLQQVGKDQANRDIRDCETLADNYVSSGKGRTIASGAGKGAVVGGATGAVLGAFGRGIGAGALMGAAVGGTAGGVSSAFTPDQVKRNFVNQCLHDRGYHVIGWS